MLYRPHWIVIPVLFLLLPAFQARAASFMLPDDAVVQVREFAFPPSLATDTAERNLAGAFHNQLVYALQQVGVAVASPKSAEQSTTIPDHSAPSSPALLAEGQPEAEAPPLVVTPLSETPKDGKTEHYLPTTKADTTTGKTDDISIKTKDETPENPPQTATQAPSVKMEYIITGQVTLLREHVGAPTRIAGGIRIRAESSLHCTYKVIDASTGNVLVSDVASGSAARITNETQDIDAALGALTTKVMTSCAVKIASDLSGMVAPDKQQHNDRSHYQDSPGKRLRSR